MPHRRRPGRPRKSWALLAAAPAPIEPLQDTSTSTLTPSESGAESLQENNSTLSIDELELLHHFTTSTCASLSDDGQIGHMYRVNLPRLGLTHQYLLRLILALAGRHLEHADPDRPEAARYVAVAEKHFAVALSEVSIQMQDLNVDNCQALYFSAILICIYIWARGPASGEYMVFSDHGTPLWLPLLRGVRSIITTMGYDVLFSGPLEAMKGGDVPQHTTTSTVAKLKIPTLHWQEPFQDLRGFISSTNSLDRAEQHLEALNSLARTFEATYGEDENGSFQGESINQIIFRWLYILDDGFMECVQERRPLALIIVAYFALSMKILDHQNCWFLKGWADHILLGISRIVEDDDYRTFLQWPMEMAGLS